MGGLPFCAVRQRWVAPPTCNSAPIDTCHPECIRQGCVKDLDVNSGKVSVRASSLENALFPQRGFNFPTKRMKRRAAFSSARRFNSYTFVCTSYVSSFVPGVPLLSALPLGRAFMIELPIALWARGTPRQLHSRRHAKVGSRPLVPRSETLRCATPASTTRL